MCGWFLDLIRTGQETLLGKERRNDMQTIDDAREHCRFVCEGVGETEAQDLRFDFESVSQEGEDVH